MDFREAKVPLYKNERKSGLNRPWFERAACWKRQEVSGTLITRWNEASRALPVLALKSNYLDRWLNDCLWLLSVAKDAILKLYTRGESLVFILT